MKNITLMMAYYNNPTMLAHQYKQWVRYQDDVKEFVEIIIVDDGSKEAAMDVPRPAGLPPLRIYRVLEDRKWHQNGARNLAASEATTDWLLMTDLDHVVPEGTFRTLKALASPKCYYMFTRQDRNGALTLNKHGIAKPHPNTFAMTRELFMRLHGYDERTCGYYGTDRFFRRKLQASGAKEKTLAAKIIRYSREDIFDASTRDVERKDGRPRGWRNELNARLEADPRPHFLMFPWRREL